MIQNNEAQIYSFNSFVVEAIPPLLFDQECFPAPPDNFDRNGIPLDLWWRLPA